MADAPESFNDYVRRRLMEALAMRAVWGTTDPDEIARLKARGPICRGISVG